MGLGRTCLLAVVLTGLGSDVSLAGSAGAVEEVPFDHLPQSACAVDSFTGGFTACDQAALTPESKAMFEESTAWKPPSLRVTLKSKHG